jgi:hypothetical protein
MRKMEEHHWGGQGWNPAVEPEEEEEDGHQLDHFCSTLSTL